jgi:hypothetical protein
MRLSIIICLPRVCLSEIREAPRFFKDMFDKL